jgi:hypothetical protein
MINLLCNHCGKVLTEPGAIVIAPPHGSITVESHICRDCYEYIIRPLVDPFDIRAKGAGYRYYRDACGRFYNEFGISNELRNNPNKVFTEISEAAFRGHGED